MILIFPSIVAWDIRLVDIENDENALSENWMALISDQSSLTEDLESFFDITTGIWGNTEYLIKEFVARYMSNDDSLEKQLQGAVKELHSQILTNEIFDEWLINPSSDLKNQRDTLKGELLVITGDTNKISSTNPQWLKEAIIETYKLNNIIVSQKKIDNLDHIINKIPQDLQDALALLLYGINDATTLINEAINNLTSAEIVFLEKNRDKIIDNQVLKIPGISNIFMDLIRGPLSPMAENSDNEATSRFKKIVDKVEMDKITRASITVMESIKISLPIILRYQNFDNEILFVDPMGLIMLGDNDENRYTQNYILSIDLGGNDNYTNNAGGAHQGVSICIDLAGDDHYENVRTAQGAGFLGTGILIDIKGNDTYISQSWSQGSTCSGMGLLMDLGGNDAYLSEKFSQGSAMAKGLGIAFDYDGDDLWLSNSYSQGKASEDALGCLIDTFGDDIYIAHENSQGRAIYQGWGVLLDIFGNDTYISDNKSQGCGDLGGEDGPSMGALIDTSGDDTYRTQELSQGYGKYSGIGILLDFMGNDNYSANSSSQAFGGLAGMGILTDFFGNDTYSKITNFDYLGIGLSFQLDNVGENHYFTPGQNNTYFFTILQKNILKFFLDWKPGEWNWEKLNLFWP